MPTALNTTKRKFHKILDSISNASSTSLATNHGKHNASTTTLPATMDPPAKKHRIMRPASAYVLPSTRHLLTPRPSTGIIMAAKKSTASSSIHTERTAPNFAPWDRCQFLERLKTYRHVDKWMGKPEKISEVQWAKRGWSCVGKERVGCVGGCAKEVVITLESGREVKENEGERSSDETADEDEWREKAQEQLVEKFAEMIVTAHEEGCLWRRKGCDDTIQRLSLANHAMAMDSLRQRYQSLLAMASELPADPSTPEGFDISNILAKIAPFMYSSPSTATSDGLPAEPSNPPHCADSPLPVNSSALILALFGWQAEVDHISGLATCTACFRRLGLWLFNSPSDSSSESSMERLDVVGEHRDYCPWINALSQNGNTSRQSSLNNLTGWEALVRALNATFLHTRDASVGETVTLSKNHDDDASDMASKTTFATTSRGRTDEEERDKERWAKLKRLKQVFHVNRGKEKGNDIRKAGNATG